MISRGQVVHAVRLSGRRHDIGSPLDWLKTNLVFAARDAKLWEQIAPLARELLAQSSSARD
jgi:UTP-glucose-1-phosphate uridylyltransferase